MSAETASLSAARIEPVVTCGYCMNCKYFKPVAYKQMGDCTNKANFYIGYGEPDPQVVLSGAVIEGDEGWGWHVGRNFGCIHFDAVGN